MLNLEKQPWHGDPFSDPCHKSDTSTMTLDVTENFLGKPHQVILFNDATHSIEEVVKQVDKATRCGQSKAFELTMEAHEKGRASVYSGILERCEHVASILEEIRLGTKIEPL
jgi:ATP-dependent Clp protease adapter protein ClpS